MPCVLRLLRHSIIDSAFLSKFTAIMTHSFLQEIKVLGHLKHENIVQYYGSEVVYGLSMVQLDVTAFAFVHNCVPKRLLFPFQVDDHLYIYLEYVHPGSINRYVREHCRDITESIVRNFTRHILNGLAYLHSTNTIHR